MAKGNKAWAIGGKEVLATCPVCGATCPVKVSAKGLPYFFCGENNCVQVFLRSHEAVQIIEEYLGRGRRMKPIVPFRLGGEER